MTKKASDKSMVCQLFGVLRTDLLTIATTYLPYYALSRCLLDCFMAIDCFSKYIVFTWPVFTLKEI